ncbi:histidinol-phosphate aminotransferase [Pluteus cervinus]|uniref:Histidinol-phosphate aminotransferase n=1 Tax=Pluteus cervinus TaxID=181527 RepID=A0ACD3ATE1_9AGAR|nr:histidinol-phosphate aminotransferase [Pluteus cervinus]
MPIHGLSPSLYPTFPAHFNIEKVIRPNILALHPYRCARDDYDQGILLDANENALGHSIPRSNRTGDQASRDANTDPTLDLDLHRYPSPSHPEIKARIASLRGLPSIDYVFLGVGSDEVIDLLMRICVAPVREKVLITPPTYGMYAVCAQVNDVGVVKVPLVLTGDKGEGGKDGRFSVRVDEVKKAIDANPEVKLIFLCSPGNPTGTLIPVSTIRELLEYEAFHGIVVVDEAYIDFAGEEASAASLVKEFGNICVMQTLSKSFGLAAIRVGIALAHPALIQVLTNTKAPYNVSTPTARLALSALSPEGVAVMRQKASTLIASRASLTSALADLPKDLGIGTPIGASDANFIVIPILTRDRTRLDNTRAQKLYKLLAEENGLVVRYRGSEPGCEGCLRITIGTEEENAQVLKKFAEVLSSL